jgi:regulatory protein
VDGPTQPPGDARRGRSPAERRAGRAAVTDPDEVLAAALRRLEIRAFAVAALRRRLVEAGYRTELVEAVLERLVALGLLDDERYARDWIESRDRARPRGAAVLRRELAQRGVDSEVIAAALAARADPERRPDDGAIWAAGTDVARADTRAAAALLARRAAALERVGDPRLRRQRAYALLARNGFDPDVCAAAVAAWIAGGANETTGADD